jgi:hypothetical protein
MIEVAIIPGLSPYQEEQNMKLKLESVVALGLFAVILAIPRQVHADPICGYGQLNACGGCVWPDDPCLGGPSIPTPPPQMVTCWDGSQAYSFDQCPQQMVTCWDGSLVLDASQCVGSVIPYGMPVATRSSRCYTAAKSICEPLQYGPERDYYSCRQEIYNACLAGAVTAGA